jgi:preprotein translocase subunit YajC
LGGSTYYWIIMIVLFVAIFYFMLMRPQQKQRKAHQELMSSLKKGDVVMTAAGIYGTVKRVEENLVVIEVAKGVTIKVIRRAVADIVKDDAQRRAVAPEGSSGARGRRSTRSAGRSSAEDDDMAADSARLGSGDETDGDEE